MPLRRENPDSPRIGRILPCYCSVCAPSNYFPEYKPEMGIVVCHIYIDVVQPSARGTVEAICVQKRFQNRGRGESPIVAGQYIWVDRSIPSPCLVLPLLTPRLAFSSSNQLPRDSTGTTPRPDPSTPPGHCSDPYYIALSPGTARTPGSIALPEHRSHLHQLRR